MNLILEETFRRILNLGNMTLLHYQIIVEKIVEYTLEELTDDELIAILKDGEFDEN